MLPDMRRSVELTRPSWAQAKGDDMTLDEFLKLRRGHVVIWRDREIRVVQKGPGDSDPPRQRGSVTFLKLKPIGYRGHKYQPWTLYGYNDVKDKITGPHLRINAREMFRLEKMRVSEWYDLKEAARSVIAEARRLLPLGMGLGARLGCMPTMGSLFSLTAGNRVAGS